MKQKFTSKDCIGLGTEASLLGRVVLLKEEALEEKADSVLAFCIGGKGAAPHMDKGAVKLVDLESGKKYSLGREQILGILKPERLPDMAKLQLSQIRPPKEMVSGNKEKKKESELYTGYCFLEDGRYAAGLWMYSTAEAVTYAYMQKPYQYRVMLCDGGDCCVMEIENGELIFPTEEMLGPEKHAYEELSMS